MSKVFVVPDFGVVQSPGDGYEFLIPGFGLISEELLYTPDDMVSLTVCDLASEYYYPVDEMVSLTACDEAMEKPLASMFLIF